MANDKPDWDAINDYLQDGMHDKAHLIQRFQEHIEEVRNVIPASQLLIFEVKEGWGFYANSSSHPNPMAIFPL